MTCQNTTYLSHKTWPDLIMRIKHLKVTCSFSARRSPLSPVTSFSLSFQLRKLLEVTSLVGAGFKGENWRQIWFRCLSSSWRRSSQMIHGIRPTASGAQQEIPAS